MRMLSDDAFVMKYLRTFTSHQGARERTSHVFERNACVYQCACDLVFAATAPRIAIVSVDARLRKTLSNRAEMIPFSWLLQVWGQRFLDDLIESKPIV